MDDPPSGVVALALQQGRDAMSFLAVESTMRHWLDAPPPAGTGACVAYAETPGAWVAACGPLVDARDEERAAQRFVAAARAVGRRACFFAAESLAGGAFDRLLIGEQPIFHPGSWAARLPRGLREQLRRAKAKGVRVRRLELAEVAPGSPARLAVEALGTEWLRGRHLEPLAFLVTIEPFRAAPYHRYFVAEHRGRLVGFLSAVPMGRRGWLVEDVFRGASAPNGTTESMVHALMLEVADAREVTLGLTPLSGPVAGPLRVVRWLSRPLFDFAGLRAFRERMRPAGWQAVWLAYPRGESAALHVVDALQAFARGSLLRFGALSLLKHPSGLPWMLALPLPAWTLALCWIAAVDRSAVLGFPRGELALWAAFDALLLLVLARVAMRPRRSRLVLATSFAVVDAALSLGHLAWVGLGSTPSQIGLRALATLAPAVGAALLAWATSRAAAV